MTPPATVVVWIGDPEDAHPADLDDLPVEQGDVGMGVEAAAVGGRVVVAGHEVVGDRDLVDQVADAVLARQPEAGQVTGVDDGGHVEALGQAASQLHAERVEVDVAHVEDAGVAVDGRSEGVGGRAE